MSLKLIFDICKFYSSSISSNNRRSIIYLNHRQLISLTDRLDFVNNILFLFQHNYRLVKETSITYEYVSFESVVESIKEIIRQ